MTRQDQITPSQAPVAQPADVDVQRELEHLTVQRRERLDVRETNQSPSGQVVDWVVAESQVADGVIASPPPMVELLDRDSRRASWAAAGFGAGDVVESDVATEQLQPGPQGTVPRIRTDYSRLPAGLSLAESLARTRGRKAAPPSGLRTGPRPRRSSPGVQTDPAADPDPIGYFHAMSTQDVLCYGGETVVNVWNPWMQNSGDHSLSQMGVQNRRDQKLLQSIEVGWEVSHDQYGDWSPHLFVYYTTNGYTKDDDNVGGYNQTVDGWTQVSTSILPETRLVPASQRGGNQQVMKIKVQLFQGNWWVQVLGQWIGYYRGSLFEGNQSVFATLADHADWIGFWGEVYSANDDPNTTITQMGSGSFGERGLGQACYQHNLLVQSQRDGTLIDSSGATTAENAAWYDIVQTLSSETSWGSFFFAGGPGADIRWDSLGGQWPGEPVVAANADGRLEVFLRGDDTDLYHLWQTSPNGPWSAPWIGLGGQWRQDPVVAGNADGRLEAFAIGDDTDLYHLWQTSPNDRWSAPWIGLGGQWHHQPVIGTNADGRMEIFIIGDDSNLYHLWQTSPNGPWSAPWIGLGGQWHHQPVIGTNADGRMEIFIIGDDSNLYHLWQTSPNGPWSAPWIGLGGQWTTDPAVASNADGRMQVLLPGQRPYLYDRAQTAPSNGWTPDWTAIRGSWHRPATMARNADGRLEIFIIGDDTDLYHAWQSRPGGSWALG
jgi:hypothetical protein